jgi:site-specific recombinase XerC
LARQAELTVWFDVMRNGSTTPPRQRPRQDVTISTKLRWAMPALREWALRHESLCSIGRDNVHSAIARKSASSRATMLSGLRSIFLVLKGRKMVFVNPTSRIKVNEPHGAVPAPVDMATLKELLNSDDPVKAALSALLAFHAVRIRQLRQLKTTDYRDGRLHLGDHVTSCSPHQ